MAKENAGITRGKRPARNKPLLLPAIQENIAPKTNAQHLDAYGREKPDPTPMAPPVGYVKTPSLIETVRKMVQTEASRVAQEQGFETFEEADDFDVGDDYDPSSLYENEFDPPIVEQPPAPEAPKAPPAPAAELDNKDDGVVDAPPAPPAKPAQSSRGKA